jgi:hypothetical protein
VRLSRGRSGLWYVSHHREFVVVEYCSIIPHVCFVQSLSWQVIGFRLSRACLGKRWSIPHYSRNEL